MTWIKDTYHYLYGEKEINAEGCVTGKFISQGGIAGRKESTGLGCFYATQELLNNESFCEKARLNTGIKGKKVIIHGFGNVGYYFAKFMHKKGAKIVGIIEKDVGIYNESGFDPDDVKMTMMQGNLQSYAHAEQLETTDPGVIMRNECHILAPCAVDGSINKYNAPYINAKVVIEGANGPTTFKAD